MNESNHVIHKSMLAQQSLRHNFIIRAIFKTLEATRKRNNELPNSAINRKVRKHSLIWYTDSHTVEGCKNCWYHAFFLLFSVPFCLLCFAHRNNWWVCLFSSVQKTKIGKWISRPKRSQYSTIYGFPSAGVNQPIKCNIPYYIV